MKKEAKALALYRMSRARETFKDGLLLLEQGSSNGAISRFYYAAFHAARALKEYAARSVVMTDRIIGCPHEEGIDYPEGEVCPRCPFWAGRDRWTGEYRH